MSSPMARRGVGTWDGGMGAPELKGAIVGATRASVSVPSEMEPWEKALCPRRFSSVRGGGGTCPPSPEELLDPRGSDVPTPGGGGGGKGRTEVN